MVLEKRGLKVTVCMVLGLLPGLGIAGSDVATVTATGEGISPESARRTALRTALEKAAGVEIASFSKTQDFQLVRDAVYARSEGAVQSYVVLDEGRRSDGAFYCSITAKVNRNLATSSWAEVQNLLDQVGRPKMAVYIQERVDDELQYESILRSRLENRLLEVGFDMVAGEHLQEVARRESVDARAEGDSAKLRKIAKDFEAEIFIQGAANAHFAELKTLAGQMTAMYNCDTVVRMYHTDSGDLMASESLPNVRGGARGVRGRSQQAGKKALANAGDELVEQMYYQILRQWTTQLSAGRSVNFEISEISYGDALKLKRHFSDLPDDLIVSVDGPKFSHGIATFHIKCKSGADPLAAFIFEQDWAASVEIEEVKGNVIKTKWKE